jgi:PAS domain S-box-containing protein
MGRHNAGGRFVPGSIVWLAVGVVLVAGALFTWRTADVTDRDMRADILRNTHLLADAIHLKGLAALTGTEEDLTSPEYLRLKDQLAAARHAFPDSRFLYLMGRKPDGRLFFYADSEPEGYEDESPAGQIYEEASEVTRRVFTTGRAETDGPVSDRWGMWVSALVPLSDPGTGKVKAVIGMDVDARNWRTLVMRKAAVPMAFTGVLVAILLGAATLLWWRSRLPEEARGRWLPRHSEALITATAGLAVTLFIAYKAYDVQDNARRETFSRLASAKAAGITEAMRDIRNIQIEGLARFFESSVHVERREFETYAGYLTEDAAVLSWQWIPAVPARERALIEEEALRNGLTEFAIWERNAEGRRTAVTTRDTYYPVFYIEPLAGNEAMLGYDMGSDPGRRAAIETAAITGLITGTATVSPGEKADTWKWIIVFRPVYGAQGRLQGFASCTLQAETMLMRAMRQPVEEEAAVILGLYQVEADGRAQLLASTSREHAMKEHVESGLWHYPDETFTVVSPLFAYGKTYAIVVHAGPGFAALHPVRAGLFFGASGFALTSVLALLVGFLGNRRYDLEQRVRHRTAELQESEQHFRTLADSGHALVWISGPDKKCDYFNKPWLAFTGRTLEQEMGDGWTEGVHPEDLSRCIGTYTRTCDRQENFSMIYRLRRHDGEYRWIQADGCPRYDTHGNFLGYIGHCLDITERIQAEEEIRILNAELEQRVIERTAQLEAANKELESFSYSVSHDLRAPLRAIHGFSQILLDDLAEKLDDEGKRYLKIISDNTNKMGELIDDLLAFSRFGRADIRLSGIEMEPLVRSVMGELTPLFAGRNVQCHIGDLTSSEGDYSMIRQVIVNLLANALKFTGQRETAIIHIGGYTEKSENIYYVRDNGVGFDMRYVHKIFSVFQRLHSDDEFEGTGIGLAIVKRIIDRHGGRVWAEGKVDEGATFYFTLPRE